MHGRLQVGLQVLLALEVPLALDAAVVLVCAMLIQVVLGAEGLRICQRSWAHRTGETLHRRK